MKTTVNVGVISILGVVVLLGSLAVTFAKPRFQVGKTYCQCACRWGSGSGNLYWEKAGACSLADGKSCTYKDYLGDHKGTLDSCLECKPYSETGVVCGGRQIQAPDGQIVAPPGDIAPPRPTAPPGGDRPRPVPDVKPK